ncbi:hypothetical protein [Bifidobacterium parmae]|uniref:Uncharacterized protein n=1 Tax=Bifidobacterium parmae TaxID=361854 RepID=A0A2N5J6H1_9BIFI|nr:hypothetical protein [Bifidobacterium parmae]PLS29811.1 hypothetical protein Uis4E_0152 [Bifidobacterium parmae]
MTALNLAIDGEICVNGKCRPMTQQELWIPFAIIGGVFLFIILIVVLIVVVVLRVSRAKTKGRATGKVSVGTTYAWPAKTVKRIAGAVGARYEPTIGDQGAFKASSGIDATAYSNSMRVNMRTDDHLAEYAANAGLALPPVPPVTTGVNRYVLNWMAVPRPYGGLQAYTLRYDKPVRVGMDFHPTAFIVDMQFNGTNPAAFSADETTIREGFAAEAPSGRLSSQDVAGHRVIVVDEPDSGDVKTMYEIVGRALGWRPDGR